MVHFKDIASPKFGEKNLTILMQKSCDNKIFIMYFCELIGRKLLF